MKTILIGAFSLFSLQLFAAEKQYCYANKDFSKEAVFVFTRGKCSNFSAKIPAHWEISIGRKKGDRWFVTDSKTKKHVGRFDCGLPNTDQKMLPEVLDKEMKLGNHSVEKYTVTLEFVESGKSAATFVTELITSYRFKDTGFSKLILMTETYDKESCLEESFEKIVKSIQVH